MSVIIVAVKYTVKQGMRDEVLKLAAINVRETRKEKGNIEYTVYPSAENDQDVFVFETWETNENLKAHSQAPHYLEFCEKRKPMLVEGTFKIKKYTAQYLE